MIQIININQRQHLNFACSDIKTSIRTHVGSFFWFVCKETDFLPVLTQLIALKLMLNKQT